jgi:hypothetical protein
MCELCDLLELLHVASNPLDLTFYHNFDRFRIEKLKSMSCVILHHAPRYIFLCVIFLTMPTRSPAALYIHAPADGEDRLAPATPRAAVE